MSIIKSLTNEINTWISNSNEAIVYKTTTSGNALADGWLVKW